MFRKLTIFATIALSGFSAAQARSVLDVHHEITDTAIVFPESVQTDVHRMQQNWYLRNFTDLSSPLSNVPTVSDAVMAKRLMQLPTTIDMPFNSVVRSHIDLYVNRRRQLVETMLGMSLYYMPIFEEALEREGLPLELRYLPVIESALNPDAVSRAGATGLWQFMLQTAKGLGMEISTLVDERRDPLVSSQMAAKYLKQLYEIYHNWSLAIAAYNCGPGNINKALLRAGASEKNPKDFWDIYYYLPQETRGYFPGFIAATYAMNYYDKHGISPALARRPILTDTVHVHNRLDFNSISSVIDVPIEELRTLNPQYRQDVIPGDIKPYALRLPSHQIYSYLMSEDTIVARALAASPRRLTAEIGGPATADAGGDDGSVTETRTVESVKWHTVKRGETLAQIARKYGVSVNEMKRWNSLKSTKVRRNQKLKIVTTQRVTVSKPKAAAPKNAPDTSSAVAVCPPDAGDTAATVQAKPQAKEQPKEQAKEQPKVKEKKAKEETKKKEPATRSYTVRKGDTLWKISQANGTTVDELIKLNKLKKGADIKVGQTIQVPRKK